MDEVITSEKNKEGSEFSKQILVFYTEKLADFTQKTISPSDLSLQKNPKNPEGPENDPQEEDLVLDDLIFFNFSIYKTEIESLEEKMAASKSGPKPEKLQKLITDLWLGYVKSIFDEIQSGLDLDSFFGFEFCRPNLHLLNRSLARYARKLRRNLRLH